jgi:hypothetical protein
MFWRRKQRYFRSEVVRVPPHTLADELELKHLAGNNRKPENCTHWQFWRGDEIVKPLSPVFATSDEMATYALQNLQLSHFAHFKGKSHAACKEIVEDEGESDLKWIQEWSRYVYPAEA